MAILALARRDRAHGRSRRRGRSPAGSSRCDSFAPCCGERGGPGSPQRSLPSLVCAASVAPAATLYTNNYDDPGSLGAFDIGSDGLLAPLPGSPFITANPLPQALAITPDGGRIVIAFSFNDLLGTATLAADGAVANGPLTPLQVRGYPAISPDGRFAYIPANGDALNVVAIGPNGELTPAGAPVPAETFVPALTPDGRYLYLPDEKEEAVRRFAVQPDGSLLALGTTPLPGIEPLAMEITPDGRFALLLSDDPPTDHEDMRTFAIGADGSLTPTGSSLPTTDATPGPPRISPNGRFAYVANINDESVTAYSLGADGGLSQVGAPTPAGIIQPQGVAVSVDGRFLYAAALFGEEIQAFAIGHDGLPAKIGSPVSTGGQSDGVTPLARPSAPIAAFSATPGPPGAATAFDASASGGSFAPIVAYEWDFGDGTRLSTAEPRVTHVYRSPGAYQAKLTVVDANGCRSEIIYTGRTAYCGGRAATHAVDTLPAIRGMRVTRVQWKRRGQGGGKAGAGASAARRKPARPTRFAVRYTLSEAASMKFAVERKV